MTGPLDTAQHRPAPLDTSPARPRAFAKVRGGYVTWRCPLCEHRSVTDPAHRLAWVLSRARYHMRWAHGQVGIPGWIPAGARRVTADELTRRVGVPRRYHGVTVLTRPDGTVLAEYLAA